MKGEKLKELYKADMRWMRIPEKFWRSDIEKVSKSVGPQGRASPYDVVVRYINKIYSMRKKGTGLILWGPSGCGKTSIACILAKEYRRRFFSVYYMLASELKDVVHSKEMFDENETCFSRAKGVDVLILDDLGKGVRDCQGFETGVLDEVVRKRNADNLITIITTNMQVASKDKVKNRKKDGKVNSLDFLLNETTIECLKEHAIPVFVTGENMRVGRLDSEEYYLMNGGNC